jgi:hypothetical protein
VFEWTKSILALDRAATVMGNFLTLHLVNYVKIATIWRRLKVVMNLSQAEIQRIYTRKGSVRFHSQPFAGEAL